MAALTIAIGSALVVLGLAGYFGSGQASVTALIPAFFGVPLMILGLMARTPDKRKLAMHLAVVVGLLGFLGSLPGLAKLPALVSGEQLARPTAVAAQSVMAVLTGILVAFSVRSFINARRAPKAGA